SHYALDIYKKYGFEVVGALTEKWGIQFIPMQKLLKPKNLE
ncbi:GNAT family N-acetyltransferase, partial [Acinetobacter baumannii]